MSNVMSYSWSGPTRKDRERYNGYGERYNCFKDEQIDYASPAYKRNMELNKWLPKSLIHLRVIMRKGRIPLIKELGIEKGDTQILFLGEGIGRNLVHFVRDGYRTVANDITDNGPYFMKHQLISEHGFECVDKKGSYELKRDQDEQPRVLAFHGLVDGNLKNPELWENFQEVSTKDGKYPLVVSCGVLNFIGRSNERGVKEEVELAVERMRDITMPGGINVLVVVDEKDRIFKREKEDDIPIKLDKLCEWYSDWDFITPPHKYPSSGRWHGLKNPKGFYRNAVIAQKPK